MYPPGLPFSSSELNHSFSHTAPAQGYNSAYLFFFFYAIYSDECQVLIENTFHDDPYFQLKYILTVLDLTLCLFSQNHLAGVNQACD